MPPSRIAHSSTASDNRAAALELWGLPRAPLSAEQTQRLRLSAMALNSQENSQPLDKLPYEKMASHALLSTQGAHALPIHMAMLALCLLKRNSSFLHYSSFSPTATSSWFDWSAPAPHLGLAFLKRRRGIAAKALLLAGTHPASFFCSTWDGSDWPAPGRCAPILVDLAASCSLDACKTLFNALDSACPDKALFRGAVAESARALLPKIWIERSGVANAAERVAVAQAAFAIERLAKKKALPRDLADISAEVLAKRATFAEAAEGFNYTSLQLQRLAALASVMQVDDIEGFRLFAPLCGLDSQAAFEAGAPGLESAAFDWLPGRYWTTKLACGRHWLCAAYLLDQGDNPWLCAGDGMFGLKAQGNPFSWLALCAQSHKDFPSFANAWVRAALRDAETRAPGTGRAYCLEAFEASRQGAAALWAGPDRAAALAACEQILIPTMLGLDTGLAPTPAPRRNRL